MPTTASQIVPFLTAVASGIFLALAALEFRFHTLWSRQTRRRIGGFILFSLCLSFAVPAVFIFSGMSAGEPAKALLSEGLNLLLVFLQAALFGVIYFAASLSQRRRGDTPPLLSPGHYPYHRRLAEVILAFALCAVWTTLCLEIAELFVDKIEVSDRVRQMLDRPSPLSRNAIALTIWLQIVFLAPLFEEITYRGFILGQFIMAFPPDKRDARPARFVAVIFSAALFALMHNGHLEPAWVKWVQIFGIGLILGAIRLRHGLIAAILTHLLFNAFGSLLMNG